MVKVWSFGGVLGLSRISITPRSPIPLLLLLLTSVFGIASKYRGLGKYISSSIISPFFISKTKVVETHY